MNIEQAIQLEKDYLNCGGRDDFYFKEKLELLGFTFDSFLEAKKEYLWNNLDLKIEEIVIGDFPTKLPQVISNGENVWFNVRSEKHWAFVGAEYYDEQFCIDNDISILSLNYGGGTIVTTDKDFCLAIPIKIPGLLSKFQKIVSNSLINLGVENEISGNDILIQGNKVCGCAQSNLGEYTGYYFQVSFQVDLDLIKGVCKKESVKIPKGINDFYPNITREDLIIEINKWLQ